MDKSFTDDENPELRRMIERCSAERQVYLDCLMSILEQAEVEKIHKMVKEAVCAHDETVELLGIHNF